MRNKNFEYLKTHVFYTGFGNTLDRQLKEKIESGEPSFELYYKAGNDYENLTAELRFSQSKETGRYFFNSFRLELVRTNGKGIRARIFYMNKNYHFTLKEAYNLLHGRSVKKKVNPREGTPYQAWMKLDLHTVDMNGNYKEQRFYENYGFDLEKELERLPLVEWQHQEEKEALLESLRRGNRQSATLKLESGDHRIFLEADPEAKSVKTFNGELFRVQYVADRSKGGRLERLWTRADTPNNERGKSSVQKTRGGAGKRSNRQKKREKGSGGGD